MSITRGAGIGARCALALAAASPAAACDPDAMDAHLTAVCDGALAPALAAALPHATPAARLAMQRALTIAGTTCATDDPVAGARIAGRIEGRAGRSPTDLGALA
jgi:hypothetical protein